MAPQMWEAEFYCACGSLIGIRHYLVTIQTTGAELKCVHCGQKYLVKENGATPLTGSGIIQVGGDTDGTDSQTQSGQG